jgi:probable F420-dependent oxidoreductase
MSQAPSNTAKPAARLGRIGVWSGELRFGDPGERRAAAAELDALGYGALWIPGGIGGELFKDMNLLLEAAPRAGVASGILNIWRHEPAEAGAWWKSLSAADQARTMLGVGVSHGPLIGAEYAKPLAKMTQFLDGLDAAGFPVEARCIAALGPKMLDLSRERSAGSHPYLAPVEHTAYARERLGPAGLLAPELGVVLESDPAKARDIARQALASYQGLPNYVNNWRRFGFSETEAAEASDRLIDVLFAWGEPEHIAERVAAHLDAGADHVCLQVIRGALGAHRDLPLVEWRRLAAALL